MMSVIEDRREGFLQSVLVAPVPRLSLALGKVLGASTVGLLQGLTFLVFAGADLVGAQVPSVDRPDVAAQFPRPTTTLLGFSINLEKTVLARGCVRVMGLTADRTAGPLLISPKARQLLNVCQ